MSSLLGRLFFTLSFFKEEITALDLDQICLSALLSSCMPCIVHLETEEILGASYIEAILT